MRQAMRWWSISKTPAGIVNITLTQSTTNILKIWTLFCEKTNSFEKYVLTEILINSHWTSTYLVYLILSTYCHFFTIFVDNFNSRLKSLGIAQETWNILENWWTFNKKKFPYMALLGLLMIRSYWSIYENGIFLYISCDYHHFTARNNRKPSAYVYGPRPIYFLRLVVNALLLILPP